MATNDGKQQLGSGGGAQYNQYNDAMKKVNDAARQFEGEGFGQVGGSGTYKDWYKVKTKMGHHKMKSRTGYEVGGNYGDDSYSNILKDYQYGTGYNSGGTGMGKSDWDTYARKVSTGYQKAMDEASQKLGDTANNWLSNYDYGNTGSNFGSLLDQQNQSYYGDAKDKLDRDLKRGYLNYAGYQTALNALNDNIANNRGKLYEQGQNKYDTWKNDLTQMRTSGFDSGVDSLSNNALNYIRNYNALKGGDLSQLGSYQNTYGQMSDYANSNIGDDSFLSALTANTYDPDTYVATGAEGQGFYNPFQRGQFNTGRKKKSWGLDNIGEY
jgi:hypothetical protein